MVKADAFLDKAEIITSRNLIEKPEVSVIMPTYCRGNNGLLSRSIMSVLEQSFTSFEFIIIDDGSEDITREVVLKHLNKDNRIVYIRNNTNSGIPALRINQAITYARGQYISYQFDDDLWEKEALHCLYTTIKDYTDPCVVYGKVQYKLVKSNHTFLFGKPFEYYELIESNRLANNSVMHDRELFYLYGGYDCHLAMRRLSDWDLWLRWAKEVPFIHVDKVVSRVEGEHEKSLGLDCIMDLPIFRAFQSIDRNDKLHPNIFGKYELDSLSFINKSRFRENIKNKHIIPWYIQHKGYKVINQIEQVSFENNKIVVLIILCNINSKIVREMDSLSSFSEKYCIIYALVNEVTEDLVDYSDIIAIDRSEHTLESLQSKLVDKPVFYWKDTT